MLIQETPKNINSFALFNLGFRPFFLLAGIYAVISMAIWMMIFIFQKNPLPANFPPMLWHAHGMIFGYSVAVISGFLLTAVRNWTGIQTLYGWKLGLLALLWVLARILPLSGLDLATLWAAWLDIMFMSILIVAITHPIIKTRQWAQLAVVSKVVLILASNILFYFGLLGWLPANTVQWGLYAGFYFVISLILLMGRRVIPFFIEKGVDETAAIKNWKWLDISSLILFTIFVIVEVFLNFPAVSSALATGLFIIHSIRLWGWHTPGIWKKPLLWVLYSGYGFIVLGFVLKALEYGLAISPWISIHAFAAGGIGLITTGMMSRVALGHTGRNVFNPPAMLKLIFSLTLIAAILRVLPPIILPAQHLWWIALSQVFWIIGFAFFILTFTPILLKARVDGQHG